MLRTSQKPTILVRWREQPRSALFVRPHDGVPQWTDHRRFSDDREQAVRELKQCLAEWSASRADVVGLVDRTVVEVRSFPVPPVPEHELPDLVRYQATQQFAQLEDDSPVDFLPQLDRDPPHVLAVGMRRATMDRLKGDFSDAGVALARVQPYPNAVAAAVAYAMDGSQTAPSPENPSPENPSPKTPISEALKERVIVAMGLDTFDAIVARGPHLLVSRSVRTPGARVPAEQAVAAMLNEIRRTLAAARADQVNPQTIVFCGEVPAELSAACEEQLACPTVTVDWEEVWRLSGEGAHSEWQRDGAAVGALLLAQHADWPSLDLLHPREVAPEQDTRQLWLGALTATLLIAFLTGAWIWWSLSSQDDELRRLGQQSSKMDQLVDVARRQERELEAVEFWYENSPNWLFELRNLAATLPPSESLQLTRLQADLINQSGGRMMLHGRVDESERVLDLEKAVRDGRHRVEGLDRSQSDADAKYPWAFVTRVDVTATEPEAMLAALRAASASAPPETQGSRDLDSHAPANSPPDAAPEEQPEEPQP